MYRVNGANECKPVVTVKVLVTSSLDADWLARDRVHGRKLGTKLGQKLGLIPADLPPLT